MAGGGGGGNSSRNKKGQQQNFPHAGSNSPHLRLAAFGEDPTAAQDELLNSRKKKKNSSSPLAFLKSLKCFRSCCGDEQLSMLNFCCGGGGEENEVEAALSNGEWTGRSGMMGGSPRDWEGLKEKVL